MTIRVLVVEDSITIRKHFLSVLSADPDIEVVGEAADGKRAIEMCEKLRPDIVTLDLQMPMMSGITATEYIMAYCPTPILIVSSAGNRSDVHRTYDALAAGAVDVLEKPTGKESGDTWERELVSRVKLVSRIKVITHPRARLETVSRLDLAAAVGEAKPAVAALARSCALVAIGASTGGPAAIVSILKALPETFSIPILLVIHVDEPFGHAMAGWLNEVSPLRVAYAVDGEPVPPVGQGRVLMAPPGSHLVVDREVLRLTKTPERHSCRPSVDVLFESLTPRAPSVLACLLTGMGRDGAQGLLALRRAGATTVAQDEATSVVYGMPREAVLLGAADKVLPLSEIAGELCTRERHGNRITMPI